MPTSPDISGVILIDKPVGPTSFDVVRTVKKALRVRSAGHTGTLDPNASGLLPICLGDATRIASFITEGVKEYEGVIRFGIETDTLDSEGTVVATRDASGISRERVEAEVARLVGTQDQIVPMYSAHKVAGRRLYELAREGQEVERPTQEITVEAATLTAWNGPDATIHFRCSKGTYIRSLAALLGQRLGSGAHLFGLRRLASGPFRVEHAMSLAAVVSLAEQRPADLLAFLLTVDRALETLPECRLESRRAISVAFGNALSAEDRAACGFSELSAGAHVRLTDPAGQVIAVGEAGADGGIRLARVLRARTGPGTSLR